MFNNHNFKNIIKNLLFLKNNELYNNNILIKYASIEHKINNYYSRVVDSCTNRQMLH